MQLHERAAELAAMESALDAAGDGAGALVLLEGPAGIGKSSLLWELRRLATDRGFETFGARCDELEQSVAFGAATLLLTAPLQRADAKERAALLDGAAGFAAPLLLGEPAGEHDLPPFGDPSQAVMRGLTWVVANLARRRPVALLIDDLQWTDLESLRWLNQLRRQAADLPVLIAATLRRGEAMALEDAVAHLAGGATVLSPSPLTETACGRALEERLGASPSTGLVEQARGVTGGNPLLLDALARELVAQDAGTGAQAADLASRLVPDSIVRTILLRLRRLSGLGAGSGRGAHDPDRGAARAGAGARGPRREGGRRRAGDARGR